MDVRPNASGILPLEFASLDVVIGVDDDDAHWPWVFCRPE